MTRARCAVCLLTVSPLMQSLLSGDVDDLLCESLDAGSVKERGQVKCGGVERGR